MAFYPAVGSSKKGIWGAFNSAGNHHTPLPAAGELFDEGVAFVIFYSVSISFLIIFFSYAIKKGSDLLNRFFRHRDLCQKRMYHTILYL
jgi:hypothetical protein